MRKEENKLSPREKENTERISTFLSVKAVEKLKIEAKGKGLNLSSLIRMIIMDHLSTKK